MKNQVAIITGAGKGIGREIAKQLVIKGAAVLLNDLDAELAEEAAKSIREQTKGQCKGMGGDVSDLSFLEKFVDRALSEFGRLDMVVANAGITLYGDFFTFPEKDFYKVLQVNLGGSFFLAQTAAKVMKKQGEGGSFLFTSSVTAHQAHLDLAAYGMTKAAIEMLAKNLVIDLSPHKINVNSIAPGATLTERTQEDPDYAKTWAKITPLGRPASVEDIAHAAVFLLSPEARHITGQNLIIDGGWTSISPLPK
ncbi:SDR family NAD(P)-dependent oxidoreductase [Pararhodonellum marinum]|uniref:SDR family NAD(P)-dependent oxidoreductase n=1 Tax=Pararhodonellum marinum TaxID=2755358 RepID=UPI0018903544|nr:SDR family oxidoreductase [Pararhodonellum marinum]